LKIKEYREFLGLSQVRGEIEQATSCSESYSEEPAQISTKKLAKDKNS